VLFSEKKTFVPRLNSINRLGFVLSTDKERIFMYYLHLTVDFIRLKQGKGKSVPLLALEWPRGFQEVKVPRFHYNGTGR